MKQVALNSEKIKSLTDGKTVVKVIVVPKKLVNIVVKQRLNNIESAGKLNNFPALLY